MNMPLKSRIILKMFHPFLLNDSPVVGRCIGRFLRMSLYSTQCGEEQKGIKKLSLASNLASLLEEDESSSRSIHKELRDGRDDSNEGVKTSLAKNLACLVQESFDAHEGKKKPMNRVEMKRLFEMRIKKKVKLQYSNGKFHDLMVKVIADPKTLKDAYDCIRVSANADLAMDGDNLPFESMAEELAHGNFDVGVNVHVISTRGSKPKEVLVLPKLKLRIIQEAIRIVLEVIYRPHFSKVSHGFRSGRGHSSALKYIRKEIHDPNWWFTLLLNKKLDKCILTKLLSLMEDKINDPGLCSIMMSMFDADVLNMEFGGFPKGHGLPQEGVLSPILMNIYLDLLDRELYRMTMRYEAYDRSHDEEDRLNSKLRGWFRRQINGNTVDEKSSRRVHCCRFMDEVFFAVSGPKEIAIAFKSEIERYVRNSLFLEVGSDSNKSDVLESNGPNGVQFLGTLIKRRMKETAAVRTVHKLKEKVEMFAEQKREAWESGTVRIGKKWLGHGLKKVKESEIKHLADSSSVLNQISCYRKSGMKTDHWYKILLKIWIQDVNARRFESEESILAKHIAEPALPQELRNAYYEFQKQAKEYVSSETAAILALLPGTTSPDCITITEITAPLDIIRKRLIRYGLITGEGYPKTCHMLIVLDDHQIINWFVGITRRWLRWYSECDNFCEIKCIISNEIRMSCIRTLAAKYRIHEAEIEKKFDSELSEIPSTHDFELEEANTGLISRDSAFDGALTYDINYSGLCLVSLARTVSESRPCYCFVLGCSTAVSCVYTVKIMERQKYPGWMTGFSSSIHPSLHMRRMGLCEQHLLDLFLGDISLQSIDFGAWR